MRYDDSFIKLGCKATNTA